MLFHMDFLFTVIHRGDRKGTVLCLLSEKEETENRPLSPAVQKGRPLVQESGVIRQVVFYRVIFRSASFDTVDPEILISSVFLIRKFETFNVL